MGNKIDGYSYLTALNILEKGLKTIDTIEIDFSSENEDLILESDCDIEAKIIIKDSFFKLSSEAKAVIHFLLETPEECLEVLKPQKYNKLSVRKIRKLIRNAWRSKSKAELIVKEIRQWLKG